MKMNSIETKEMVDNILEEPPQFNIGDTVASKKLGNIFMGTVVGLGPYYCSVNRDTVGNWIRQLGNDVNDNLNYVYTIYIEEEIIPFTLDEAIEQSPKHMTHEEIVDRYNNHTRKTNFISHPGLDLELVE